jgi:hypothetical protein
MTYQLKPLTDHETGAEVSGIDLTLQVSDELREMLNTDFARYLVLAIRVQKFGPEQFI